MWLWLYNFFIAAYQCVAICLTPFSAKAGQMTKGRKQSLRFLSDLSTPKKRNRIWVHCSSLGEFEQAKPLLQKIKNNVPDCFVFLTFFSPSGFNVHSKTNLADCVLYLPADTSRNAGLLISALQPTLVLWTKYDFYYHYLSHLKNSDIPTILFSARFLPKQVFFKTHGVFFRSMLRCFSAIFVQDKNSVDLLQAIGIKSIHANDTRFDRVVEIAQNPIELSAVKRFIGGRKVIVCGSTWAGDEEMLAAVINRKIFANVCWIVAPHNISDEDIQRVHNAFTVNKVFFSNLDVSNAEVLIIDNIGMLSSLYSLADIAYVGGGFGVSVHNVLEAAVYGIPVVFGVNYQKSVECVELLQLNAAFSFSSSSQLESHFKFLLSENNAVKIGEIARRYVMQRTGGTDQIFNFVRNHFLPS